METYEERLDKFVNGCQGLIDENHKQFTHFIPTRLRVSTGRRYIKIIVTEARGQEIDEQFVDSSVYCFIDKKNGDVLKSASWKAPAKHARGNIFDNFNGLKRMSAYGAAYL